MFDDVCIPPFSCRNTLSVNCARQHESDTVCVVCQDAAMWLYAFECFGSVFLCATDSVPLGRSVAASITPIIADQGRGGRSIQVLTEEDKDELVAEQVLDVDGISGELKV